QRLAAAGYRAHAVLNIEQITRVLLDAGRLSPDQAATLVPESAATDRPTTPVG
ncbi:MAG: hypothetical protein RLZZ468_2110, partial [Cyanobacteriota bacterium]